MAILYHGDCLEEMKQLDDDSVDLIFCDLPYGQTSCKWDCKIDLTLFWEQIMRIKKLNTPIFFTTTTKFGVSLINSAPKKCPFRYDIVWVKSASSGFLCSSKMPLRKHEMVYCFYSKLPFYDLSSHKHKFIKPPKETIIKDTKYGTNTYDTEKRKKPIIRQSNQQQYDPPLPVSIVKESPISLKQKLDTDEVFKNKLTKSAIIQEPIANEEYDKREKKTRNTLKTEENYGKGYLEKKVNFRKFDPKLGGKNAPSHLYEPPLPTSVVKEEKTQISKPQEKDLYGESKGGTIGNVHGTNYEPPLPTSIIKEPEPEPEKYDTNKGSTMINGTLGGAYDSRWQKGHQGNSYEPPLPTSIVSPFVIKSDDRGEKFVEQILDTPNITIEERIKRDNDLEHGEYILTENRPEYETDSVLYGDIKRSDFMRKGGESMYESPLPNTMLEIKSTRGKHSTEKPVALMSWILKYYSKEGDVILDPTMGSGSTGIACKNMNRNFIGIEKDAEIYEGAFNRIHDD